MSEMLLLHIYGHSELNEAQNKRLMLVSEPFSAQEIVDILHEMYPAVQLPLGHPETNLIQIQQYRNQKILNTDFRSLRSSIRMIMTNI